MPIVSITYENGKGGKVETIEGVACLSLLSGSHFISIHDVENDDIVSINLGYVISVRHDNSKSLVSTPTEFRRSIDVQRISMNNSWDQIERSVGTEDAGHG